MSEFGMKSSILTHEVRFSSWTKSGFAWSPRKPSCCYNNSVALNIATWRPGASSRLMQQTFRGLGLVELGLVSVLQLLLLLLLLFFLFTLLFVQSYLVWWSSSSKTCRGRLKPPTRMHASLMLYALTIQQVSRGEVTNLILFCRIIILCPQKF